MNNTVLLLQNLYTNIQVSMTSLTPLYCPGGPNTTQSLTGTNTSGFNFPESNCHRSVTAQFTFSTLPFSEMLRPGFFSNGRPSLSHASMGGGTALLWQSSSTVWLMRAEMFCSSPMMFGGTTAINQNKRTFGHCRPPTANTLWSITVFI